jgi:hypothetical protein
MPARVSQRPSASRLRASLAGATLLLLLAGCGAAASPTAPPSSAPSSPTPTGPLPSPGSAAALILRVTSEGGFINPAATLAALPLVSVYADGRILTPGAIDTIYPGPLVLPVAVRDVGTVGAEAIVAAIRAAGLDQPGLDDGGVAVDTGSTVFSVNLDGSVVTNRLVLGGASGPGGPGLPGAGSPDPVVSAVEDLLSRLSDPAETWGSASMTSGTLVPTAYRVFVAPGAPAGDLTEPALDWPLATPLADFGVPAVPDRGIAGLRQGALLGDDAVAATAIFSGATAISPFRSEGSLFTLYVRPLLPDEVPSGS